MSIISFLLYTLIGFLAQLIDGTLGMAYGVSGRTFLATVGGLSGKLASGLIHLSEVPVSLVSGYFHFRNNNYHKDKIIKLLMPGMIGGFLGAYFLSSFGESLELYIDIYLILVGAGIFINSFTNKEIKINLNKILYVIGFLGGFFDASGGGGWGPIVTSTMLMTDQDAKKSIGTVNIVEFFVTMVEAFTFIFFLKEINGYMLHVFALIIGGVIAAPIAVNLCKKIPSSLLKAFVGILIIIMNVINVYNLFCK